MALLEMLLEPVIHVKQLNTGGCTPLTLRSPWNLGAIDESLLLTHCCWQYYQKMEQNEGGTWV